MNRKVGQASRLSGSAGFQPAPAGKMHGEKTKWGISMIRNAELKLWRANSREALNLN